MTDKETVEFMMTWKQYWWTFGSLWVMGCVGMFVAGWSLKGMFS